MLTVKVSCKAAATTMTKIVTVFSCFGVGKMLDLGQQTLLHSCFGGNLATSYSERFLYKGEARAAKMLRRARQTWAGVCFTICMSRSAISCWTWDSLRSLCALGLCLIFCANCVSLFSWLGSFLMQAAHHQFIGWFFCLFWFALRHSSEYIVVTSGVVHLWCHQPTPCKQSTPSHPIHSSLRDVAPSLMPFALRV